VRFTKLERFRTSAEVHKLPRNPPLVLGREFSYLELMKNPVAGAIKNATRSTHNRINRNPVSCHPHQYAQLPHRQLLQGDRG
jgi:hypothetical protein